MSEIAEPQPGWSELSESVKRAFGFAAASLRRVPQSKTGAKPMVVSGALLFGILMSHRGGSEPEDLLRHFGRTQGQLFDALERHEREMWPEEAPLELDFSVDRVQFLDDWPTLSGSVENILTRSWELARSLDPAPDGKLHLPMLFGGILGVEGTGAYRALAEVLGGVSMQRIYADYREYLSLGPKRPRRYRTFLEARMVATGNLRGAVNDTVAVEDQLGFAHYVDAFAELIAAPDTHPPLTIGIYGSWGMGKSFLLRHIESRLQEEGFKRRPRSPGSELRPDVHVVHFNAWEYSAAEVIWPSLVRKILDKLEETWSRQRRFMTRFWRNLRRQTRQFRGRLVLVALILAVVLLVSLLQPGPEATIVGGAIAVLGIGGFLKLITDTLANPLGQYVTALAEDGDYGKHIGYMTEIHDDLRTLEKQLRRDNDRILVVIDDLDRCEPEKAVEVLQAINLLLNFPSFIVCLGIDARIITAAVEKHYENLLGEVGASGHEYLEKIVQIPFRIPQPGEEEIKNFISKQMGDPKPPSQEDGSDDARGKRGTEIQPKSGNQRSEREENGGRKPSQGSTPPPAEEVQADTRVPFTHDELTAFQDVASFLRPNPRHLKRLVNVYRLVRSLAVAKNERAILDNPAATIRWLVMCAQWPYTSHMMLWQYGKKLEEWDGKIPADALDSDPLLHLLDEVSPHLLEEEQRKFDEGSKSLREFLEREDGRLTWEELRKIRQYTINFNPAVEGEMRVRTAAEYSVEPTSDGSSDAATSQAQAKDTPA